MSVWHLSDFFAHIELLLTFLPLLRLGDDAVRMCFPYKHKDLSSDP